MPLTEQDRERVRYHMGYLGVGAAASLQFGIPRATQTLYLVEQAMSNLIESVVPRVRSVLSIMDGIEQKLVEAQDRMAATQLDELHLNTKEPDQLEGEYIRWGNRLADIMGAPLNPNSKRYGSGSGGGAGNIPVTRPRM